MANEACYFFIVSAAAGIEAADSVTTGTEASTGAVTAAGAAVEDVAAYSPHAVKAKANKAATRAEYFI